MKVRMPTTDRKLRVFLCHSLQDKPIVRELYQRLNAEGWIDPWLDEEKLLPRQDWDMKIEKAVEDADAVIVCLSNNSVTKDGYVQKELNKVLSIAEQKPEGTIFIIPLRLEDCQPPNKLQIWQYLDYFPKRRQKERYSKLLVSLNLRSERLLNSIQNDKSQEIENDFHYFMSWYQLKIVDYIDSLNELFHKKAIEEVGGMIPELLHNAHTSMSELKSLHTLIVNRLLEKNDLRSGLENLISVWSKRITPKYHEDHPLRIILVCPENVQIPLLIRNTLLRIVSETLANALMHSGIIENSDVFIKLNVKWTQTGIVCNVSDNGIGMDGIHSGLGIERMRDLTRQLNSLGEYKSSLSIKSAIGKGTKVHFIASF